MKLKNPLLESWPLLVSSFFALRSPVKIRRGISAGKDDEVKETRGCRRKIQKAMRSRPTPRAPNHAEAAAKLKSLAAATQQDWRFVNVF
ncbi:hypothetical protein EVAR_7089_1 [Eumeta japonica]|uniref:Uncharacterized protein n=1 Tax=Eumeta variegata TaxID=151549 RepID=A0A4C1YBN3_EUMVA|nr:hypothetical protein EVAR_7089_1 [Eumeta japonica]